MFVHMNVLLRGNLEGRKSKPRTANSPTLTKPNKKHKLLFKFTCRSKTKIEQDAYSYRIFANKETVWKMFAALTDNRSESKLLNSDIALTLNFTDMEIFIPKTDLYNLFVYIGPYRKTLLRGALTVC